MLQILTKLAGLLILFVGEGLAIYAEMVASRNTVGQPFVNVFLKALPTIFIAGIFLIAGYMLSFRAFKNIWVVSAISITSILIVEPLTTYLVFHELPGRGPIVGLGLGILGFAAALFL